MSQSLSSLIQIPLVLSIMMLATVSAASEPHHKHQKTRIGGMKSLHFTLYLSETFNKTAYFIVKGVAGPGSISRTASPFGSLMAFHAPLTQTADPNSKVLGYAEGFDLTKSFDGLRSASFFTVWLNLKGYKGELITAGTAYLNQSSEIPFVAGTGDFRFIQGYMLAFIADGRRPTITYKVNFNIYWPPYAPLAN